MKKYIYYCGLILIGLFSTLSCTDEDVIAKPGNDYSVKPLDIHLTFSQSGIKKDVDATAENPSFTLQIYKNEVFLSTDVTFRSLTKEEMGNDTYIPLEDDQWTVSDPTLTFNEDEVAKTVTITLNNLDRMEDLKTYALGITIVSGNPAVSVDNAKGRLIVELSKGKSGSINNPFSINTAEDLKEMKEKLKLFSPGETVYFTLKNDIDASSVTDWEPLNQSDDKAVFRRIHFDGDGHTIRNFSCINRPYASFFGLLFGTVMNTTFENAHIESSNTSIGIVAGQVNTWAEASNTVISGIHVSGTVKSKSGNGWTGGMFGSVVNHVTIEKSSSTATVTGTRASGMIGEANFVTISTCFFNGTVNGSGSEGDDAVGGLVGVFSNSAIANSYSSGNITSSGTCAGGLVGKMNTNTSITDSYSTATVEASSNAAGIAANLGWSANSSIKRCVGWNSKIKSLHDTASGRIAGWSYAGGDNGNIVYEDCWGRTDMEVNENVNITINQDNAIVPNESNKLSYNGKDATNLIALTKETLKWDSSVWDFSGNSPVLAWEK